MVKFPNLFTLVLALWFYRLRVKWTSLQWKKLASAIVSVSPMAPLPRLPQRNYPLKNRSLSIYGSQNILCCIVVNLSYFIITRLGIKESSNFLIIINLCNIFYFNLFILGHFFTLLPILYAKPPGVGIRLLCLFGGPIWVDNFQDLSLFL